VEVSFANFAELCEALSQSANLDGYGLWLVLERNFATLRGELWGV